MLSVRNISGWMSLVLLLCAQSFYAANYTMVNGTQSVPCGGGHNVYDPGGTVDYAASLNITQTFTAATAGQCLALNITSFNTESGWDYLYIYDGTSTGAPMLMSLSGSPAVPQTFTSTSGSLTLQFISDGSVQYTGFTATLSCMTCAPAVPSITMTNGTAAVACGTTYNFLDPGGAGNYANSINVTQTLNASTPGQCLTLTITSFASEANFDVLTIYDGTTTGGALLGTLTGAPTLPVTFTSTGGSLTFNFTSDGSLNSSGWLGSISCTSSCATVDPNVFLIGNSTASTCVGTFYDSGGAGGNYGNNQNLTYTLCSSQSGQCLQMNFTSFDLENNFDFLRIYDGPNTLGTLLGTYTGATLPPTVTSSTGCLTFNFTTDGSGTRPGWAASISCVPCGGGPCASVCSGGPAPANDACSGAQNLGALPTPSPCPSGAGTALVTNTTNLCATAEFPYSSLLGCQPLGDQASPAADVWYQFTITGPVLQVVINGLNQPNVALYEGTNCINLVPRGCAIGGGGVLNTSFQGLAAGTYFLQISGGDLADQCDFTLTLRNSFDCAGCVIQSSLTANPEPINGEYQANTTVTFCYTITSYNQTSANWLHGVVPTFGPGWNPATLTTAPPASCSTDGFWAWYNSNVTSTATGATYGPGFYYETASGGGTGNDGNPGNNFGDNNPGFGNPPVNPCSWTFCWTITTDPDAGCVQGSNLNISINTLGDGESGSWTSLACTTDPVNTFFAQLNCCPDPTVNVIQPTCPTTNNGSITAQGQGTGPWTYIWFDSNGSEIQVNNNVAGSAALNNVLQGNYQVTVTDATGCTVSELITLTATSGLITPTFNAVGPYCIGAVIPALPTTSTNGITGTWTPAINNTTTTTYTFTPTAGQCATTTTRTITINPNVTPTFNAVGPYCSGAVIPALPTTSTNGITGTWSPAINNTTTTTYTFTPTAGQCAITATTTIIINTAATATIQYAGAPYCTDITSLQTPVISGTTGGTFSASPSGLSINPSNGSILPSSSSGGTYTIAYTLPAAGGCPAFTTTASVSITPLPSVPALSPTNPCANTAQVFTATGGGQYEFFINGVSQGLASPTNTLNTSGLAAGTEVCVESTPLPPFIMNGNINEPQWGPPLATSAGGPAASGFGANNRIDALYLKNLGGKLYGAIAGNENDGNDQMNNNWILMFIDSKAGGFNNLSSWTNRSNAPTNTSGILNLSLYQSVIFDAGFNPDYILSMNQANATAYFDLYDMTTNTNIYLGSNTANPALFGFLGNAATGDFTRGFEFTVGLNQLGSPATQLSVFVMMVNDPNGGDQTFLSNQFLTRAGSNQGNYGNGSVNFSNEPPQPILFMLSADCSSEQCVIVQPQTTPVFNPLPLICYGDLSPVLPTTSLNGITGTWSPQPISNTTSATYTFTPTPPQCATTQTMDVNVNPNITTSPLYHD